MDAPPVLDARCAIVIDASDGCVLFEKNADERVYPASTTKLVTVLLGATLGDLDRTVTVSKNACDVPVDSSLIPLNPGEDIRFEDLLYATMICSGNEGANVIAETASGSVDAFVDLMNQYARLSQCDHTQFTNANGYHDPEHYTTARDMARMAQAAMRNETLRAIAGTDRYALPASNLHGARQLALPEDSILSGQAQDPSAPYKVIGIKSGYHQAAGYCFVGAAERDGMEVITAVFDTTSEGRWTDTRLLVEYGFSVMDSWPAKTQADHLAMRSPGQEDGPRIYALAFGALAALALFCLYVVKGSRERAHAQADTAPCRALLTEAGVEALLQHADSACRAALKRPKGAAELKAALHRLLLRWQADLGADCAVTLTLRKCFGDLYVSLRAEEGAAGAQAPDLRRDGKNPPDGGHWPGWMDERRYAVQMAVPMGRLHPLGRAFVSMLLALAAWRITAMLPLKLQLQLTAHVVEPAFSAFLRLITFLIAPALFFTLVRSTADAGRSGGLRRKAVVRFLCGLPVVGLLALFACLPFLSASASLSLHPTALIGGITDACMQVLRSVPISVIHPFLEGDLLQIALLGAIVGVALSLTRGFVPGLERAAREGYHLTLCCLRLTMKAMPALVFFGLWDFLATDYAQVVQSAGGMLWLDAGLLLGVLLLYTLIAGVRLRTAPHRVLSQIASPIFVALSTASPLSAYPALHEACVGRMGLPERRVQAVLPLGLALFKVGMVVHYLVLCLGVAQMQGIEIDLGYLVLSALTVLLFSVVYLPTPVGNYAMLISLFAQLSLPSSGLAIAISADILLGPLACACSAGCLLIETALICKADGRAADRSATYKI